MQTNEWIRLPIGAAQDEDLTPVDVLVLAYIIDQTNTTEKAISEKRISEKIGITDRQARTSIKRLEETGYITVKRRAGQKNLYRHTNVLPPKGKTQQKDKKIKNSFDADFDVEEYKALINNI